MREDVREEEESGMRVRGEGGGTIRTRHTPHLCCDHLVDHRIDDLDPVPTTNHVPQRCLSAERRKLADKEQLNNTLSGKVRTVLIAPPPWGGPPPLLS
jgi:hypothetical protein